MSKKQTKAGSYTLAGSRTQLDSDTAAPLQGQCILIYCLNVKRWLSNIISWHGMYSNPGLRLCQLYMLFSLLPSWQGDTRNQACMPCADAVDNRPGEFCICMMHFCVFLCLVHFGGMCLARGFQKVNKDIGLIKLFWAFAGPSLPVTWLLWHHLYHIGYAKAARIRIIWGFGNIRLSSCFNASFALIGLVHWWGPL